MAVKFDGIIFDLDGTLWNATEQIMNAWNVILSKHPEISRGKLEFSELRQCMGLVMYDIAAKLFPDETEDKRNSLMDEMCSYENEYLSIHGGTLYPGLEDTLRELKKSYRLFIVSNCQSGYIEAFLHAHNLSSYFEDTECWEEPGQLKVKATEYLLQEIILKILCMLAIL